MGMPSSHTVQAPQSPASQPFLTPNYAPVTQEGAQALSRCWLGGKQFAVDVVVHPGIGRAGGMRIRNVGMFHLRSGLRQLGADLLSEIAGEVALVSGRAVDVIEVSVGRDALVERAPQLCCGWRVRESQLDRPRGRRRDRDQEIVASRVLRADQQRRRPPEMRERGVAEREALR
jgi:hypothetical protein